MTDDDGAMAWARSTDIEVRRRALASALALLLALLFAALIYLVIESNNERDAAARDERRSFEIIMASRNIERSIALSEAALGRFIINGDGAPATIYRNEWRAAGQQVDRLQRIVRDNPEQFARAERLEELYDLYGREIAGAARLAAAGRNFDALSTYNSVTNSQNGVDAIRLLEEITEQERDLLSERSTARRETNDRARLLATLLTLAGIILAIASLILAYATVRAFRQRTRADQRAEELEAAVSERTAELEAVNARLRAEGEERAAAEQKLNQVQKLEAVGQLTGGIAHDFNNMLAVVIGGLDLAKRKIVKDPENAGHHIENALEGANRAAALTRRLLTFARAEPFLPEGTDAVELINSMADLLKRSIGERISVSIDAEDDSWPIWVDRHQLENAVLNLAVNARDAMDGEGALTIAVRNRTLEKSEIGEAEAGDYLQIAVSDTGSGMDEKIIEHVFEPFFTTKAVGKGTGLGLSQIFGFVRQSGGDVGIESAVDIGTTVSMFLPRFDGDVINKQSEAEEPKPIAEHNRPDMQTILVVEDDVRVRRSTTAGLEELGHAVLSCGSGKTALEMLSARPDVDLLLTDIVMPEMAGTELAAEVVKIRPELPILFVTGYAGETGDGVSLGDYPVLRKPFTVAALAEALSKAKSGDDATISDTD